MNEKMVDRQYRCPVCGAPIEGEKCEYCGCVIYDFAVIDTKHPRYIRLLIDDPIRGTDQKFILQMKAVAVNPEIEIESSDTYFTDSAGNRLGSFCMNQEVTMKVEFRAVMEEPSGSLFTVMAYDKPYRESWRDDIE